MLAQAMAEMYKKETGRCGRLGDQQSDCATRAGRGKLARFLSYHLASERPRQSYVRNRIVGVRYRSNPAPAPKHH